MAEGLVQLPPDSTGKMIRAISVTEGPNTVYQPVEVVADSSGNTLDGSGRIQGTAHAPNSGTGGATVTSAANGRVVSVWGYANGADGTITFHGGTLDAVVITVRSGTSFAWSPGTEQTCTSNVVFSGAMDYFIEWA